ncbi:MAG: acetyl-CoA carboxylase biotin carboxyl carrier protein [Candidatus Velthaea sp.]
MDDNEAARIRALGEVLKEFDLDAIRVKIGDAEYELVRRESQAAAPPVYAMPPPAPDGTWAAAPAEAAPGATAPSNAKKVTAPVVGVFYRAASPGADPFVSVGDRVQAGQTVCILEAMKLMNEITTDFAGVVTRILPENGELVSLGEELLWIEP